MELSMGDESRLTSLLSAHFNAGGQGDLALKLTEFTKGVYQTRRGLKARLPIAAATAINEALKKDFADKQLTQEEVRKVYLTALDTYFPKE